MLLTECHHIMREVEDGVIDRHIEIIKDAIHASLSLTRCVTLSVGFCLPFVKAFQLEFEITYQQTGIVKLLHGLQFLLTFLMRHHLTQGVHCMLRSDCS